LACSSSLGRASCSVLVVKARLILGIVRIVRRSSSEGLYLPPAPTARTYRPHLPPAPTARTYL
jgi:hypothetical protein